MRQRLQMATWGLSVGIVGIILSHTPVVQAKCHVSETIAGLDFGGCNDQIGISIGEFTLTSKARQQFGQKFAFQFDGVIAQYNAEFPVVYAQWEAKQRVAIAHPQWHRSNLVAFQYFGLESVSPRVYLD